MAIENAQDLINEILKHGMTLDAYSYIYIALTALVSSAIGAYCGAYFKKRGKEKAIQASFDKVLNRLKVTTSLTEEIKASIGISTLEHQIRFSKLHEKRIEIIEGLYHRLTRIEKTGREFICYNVHSREIGEQFHKAQKAISEFIDYSKLNKFWVAKELFDEIEKVALRIDKIVHGDIFYSAVDPLKTQALTKQMKNHRAAIDEINKEIPKAKEKIIESIRKVLDPDKT